MKVALVHDYLCEYGGAERVLEVLHEIFPEAPVYVSFVDANRLGIQWSRFKNWDIRQSNLTKLPIYKKLYSPYRVFAASFFKKFDLSEYDLVISSSNAYQAKAVKPASATHYCYCHTPPRALYGYVTGSNWKKNPVIRMGGELINHFMRLVDYQAAQTVDHFIANSMETKRRIKKFYRRDSVVINPPVNVNTDLKKVKQNGDYYLFVNRLNYAKHPEIAVQTALDLNLDLKVVGVGKMMNKLSKMSRASNRIELLGSVKDQTLNDLYQHAKALLYPVEDEDFGIVPVEAMSFGVPVIAHRSGGPMETVIDNKTGLLFNDLSVEGLTKAIKSFKEMKFDRNEISKFTKRYNKKRFKNEIKKLVLNKGS